MQELENLLTVSPSREKFYHCVWCFDFANLDAQGVLIEDTESQLNHQAIATFFTPRTILTHKRVSIGALAIAMRNGWKLWSAMALGVVDSEKGMNELSFTVIAPDPQYVKRKIINEIKKRGKQTTERTRFYVIDITQDFLQLLATTNINLSEIEEINVTPEEDFLQVGASEIPDIKAQLQQGWI